VTMCKDFSCIVTQSHKVLWKRGLSSHDQIYSMFVNDYPELKDTRNVKIEVTPDKSYLYPENGWTLEVDENEIPSWFSGEHKKSVMREFRKWKKETYALINIEEARNPINPLKLPRQEVTELDIENLKKWASVRASVGTSVRASVGASIRASVGASVGASIWASVWDSVGASIWASVWDSVRASVGASIRASVWASVGASIRASVWDLDWDYAGSLFDIWGGEYKYQPGVDIWKRGFVASFDGKTWRLHSCVDAKIVYTLEIP
jgi:hypothetical protein